MIRPRRTHIVVAFVFAGMLVLPVSGVASAACLNGIVEAGEQCDDGNLSNGDTCTTSCQNAVCGDGFINVGDEACDDRNVTSGDGCSATCNLEANACSVNCPVCPNGGAAKRIFTVGVSTSGTGTPQCADECTALPASRTLQAPYQNADCLWTVNAPINACNGPGIPWQLRYDTLTQAWKLTAQSAGGPFINFVPTGAFDCNTGGTFELSGSAYQCNIFSMPTVTVSGDQSYSCSNCLSAGQSGCPTTQCCSGLSCSPSEGGGLATCRTPCGNGMLETNFGEQCDKINGSFGPCCDQNTCKFKSNTSVCRAAAGVCDQEEKCSGFIDSCPDDAFKGPATVCRTAAGPCDKAENCVGDSANCSVDALQVAGYECAALDVPTPPPPGPYTHQGTHKRVCNGTNASCPAATNAAPSISPIDNQSTVKGTAASLIFGGSDNDGDVLYFSASGLPTGLSLTHESTMTAKISGTVVAYQPSGFFAWLTHLFASLLAQVGGGSTDYSVTVTAKDGFGGQGTRTFDWEVILPASSSAASSSAASSQQSSTASSSAASSTASSAASSSNPASSQNSSAIPPVSSTSSQASSTASSASSASSTQSSGSSVSSASSAASSCAGGTNPILKMTGLPSVVVYEQSAGPAIVPPIAYVFQLTDPRLAKDINEGPGAYDIFTGAEYYDVFVSDADGVFNIDGAYLTIEAYTSWTGADAQAGHNIDAAQLRFTSGSVYADGVTHVTLGTNLSTAYQNAKGYATRALKAPDNAHTYLGNGRASLTLKFSVSCAGSSSSASSAASSCASSSEGACRPLYSGVATTVYFNTKTDSVPTHVTFPATCPNPKVLTQSYTDGVKCSTTGGGITTCPHQPATTSQDVFSIVKNLTPQGFDTFLRAQDGVWVGAVSPKFRIGWQATCGDESLPLCDPDALLSGQTATTFANDPSTTNSNLVNVTFPSTCQNPAVIMGSPVKTLPCSTTGTGPTSCLRIGTTVATIHGSLGGLTPQGFKALLSADNPVWAGTQSLPITWTAACASTKQQCDGTTCGDGKKEGSEECDDGNVTDGDGCDHLCKEEDGWECSSQGSSSSAGASCRTDGAQAVAVDQCAAPVSSVFCNQPFYKDITFRTAYAQPPDVLVTPQRINNGPQLQCTGSATDKIHCYPTNITATGFRLNCAGSPLTSAGGACGANEATYTPVQANWIAVDSSPSCGEAQSDHLIMPVSCTGTNAGGLCSTTFTKRIDFATPFATAPNVLVAPENISHQGGCVGQATDQILCFPDAIDAAGFTLKCSGSPYGSNCAPDSGDKSRADGGWLARAGTNECHVESKHRLETTTCTGTETNRTCSAPFQKQVTFDTAFTAPPVVIISPELVTSGYSACAAGATDTVICEAKNITTTGFTAVCSGSPAASTSCGGVQEGWFTSALFGYMAMDASCSANAQSSAASQSSTSSVLIQASQESGSPPSLWSRLLGFLGFGASPQTLLAQVGGNPSCSATYAVPTCPSGTTLVCPTYANRSVYAPPTATYAQCGTTFWMKCHPAHCEQKVIAGCSGAGGVPICVYTGSCVRYLYIGNAYCRPNGASSSKKSSSTSSAPPPAGSSSAASSSAGSGDQCTEICGDGKVVGSEECDDGNTQDGDGCDHLCKNEDSSSSGGSSSSDGSQSSSAAPPFCGDGAIETPEECDDGNQQDGDGCAHDCTIEPGAKCEEGGLTCPEPLSCSRDPSGASCDNHPFSCPPGKQLYDSGIGCGTDGCFGTCKVCTSATSSASSS